MFSKLKKITNFKKEVPELPGLPAIKDKLCNGLFDVMNNSFEQRKSDKNNSNYTPADVDQIIEQYANQNRMIAIAASIVPGPFGVLGAVPELLLNFKNQMSMIYDLGCAHGKENFINKDVLLDIPIAAFGGNTNLANLQGSTTDLMDAPKKVLIEKSFALGESIIQRSLKKSVVQFIPVAGPILMGNWAKLTTAKISKGSINFLDQQVNYTEHFKPAEDAAVERLLQIEKIKALANLIESNNDINENQIDLIKTIIDNANLKVEEKEYYLQESMKTGSSFKLDKELLKKYEEEDDLIMQLVVMAGRTGEIDALEKQYIYETGEALEVDRELVDSFFE